MATPKDPVEPPSHPSMGTSIVPYVPPSQNEECKALQRLLNPTDTDATKVARFNGMRKAEYIPQWNLATGDQVQVWYCYANGVPEMFLQDFNFPIESIKFIRADAQIKRQYRELFKTMHSLYESLYQRKFSFYILRPADIIAGKCAIAQVFPSIRQLKYEFDELYYQRVLILETFVEEGSHLIQCYCVDIGITLFVDFRHLFYMLEDFARLPQKTIEISLDELARWNMRTDLRNLLLNGLHLHNSIITLTVQHVTTSDGKTKEDVRMESSRFPGKDLLAVIKDLVTKLRKEPTRTRFLELEGVSFTNRLLSFTSMTPVPLEGINFGTPGGPTVHPEVNNLLDFVVTGAGYPGILHITPYTTTKTHPLRKFKINDYYDHYWIKNIDRCHCLKDGSYFCVKTKTGYERCKVLRREYGKAFVLTPKNKEVLRTVKVCLLDKGDVINVKSSDLRYMPPEYAVLAPAQAVVANWCRTDNNGSRVVFDWNDRLWDAFGRFAVNNNARFFGQVRKVSRDPRGLIFVSLDLRNPTTGEVLDPKSNFWLKPEPEPQKKYYVTEPDD